MHKSGFVNIIGNPNVGKSTLMNALVGEKLSIITSKAQTTRHRIMGIVSGEDFQIVYSDTPGILKPSYKLQESMMKFVTGAVTDADVILYVTDTVEQGDRSAEIIGRIRESGIPTVVVINKIDLSTPEALDALVDKWRQELPEAQIVPASAKENFNIEGLFKTFTFRHSLSPDSCVMRFIRTVFYAETQFFRPSQSDRVIFPESVSHQLDRKTDRSHDTDLTTYSVKRNDTHCSIFIHSDISSITD